MSEPGEVDGSGYTRGSGHTFEGDAESWRPETISIPFEWVATDETGVSSGPIRNGEIIGGLCDGMRLPGWENPQPSRFRIDPDKIKVTSTSYSPPQ